MVSGFHIVDIGSTFYSKLGRGEETDCNPRLVKMQLKLYLIKLDT